MKPKLNYKGRPKKTGAKKKQKIASQKRRLIAAGFDKDKLNKLNEVQIRELLKKAGRKKGPRTAAKKKAKSPAKGKAKTTKKK